MSILNKESFNNYVKSKNFTNYDYKGFYTHDDYIYLVSINKEHYKPFVKKLTNRKAKILIETKKKPNKAKKQERYYFLIDTLKDNNISLSVKTLFKKYNLLYRPIYYVKLNEKKQSRNKA